MPTYDVHCPDGVPHDLIGVPASPLRFVLAGGVEQVRQPYGTALTVTHGDVVASPDPITHPLLAERSARTPRGRRTPTPPVPESPPSQPVTVPEETLP